MAAASAWAAGPSGVSLRNQGVKCPAISAAANPSSSRARGGSTAAISSLRMQMMMAVWPLGMPGRARRSAGSTQAAGLRLAISTPKPSNPLLAESAAHGTVPAKASRASASNRVKPPGAKARARSQTSAMATTPKRIKNIARRNTPRPFSNMLDLRRRINLPSSRAHRPVNGDSP